jgi:hypothetical protein
MKGVNMISTEMASASHSGTLQRTVATIHAEGKGCIRFVRVKHYPDRNLGFQRGNQSDGS